MHDIYFSWDACFQWKRLENQTIKSVWTHPPQGVPKLNFDGSFSKGRKGGFGGVIRYGSGQIICSLLGPLTAMTQMGQRFMPYLGVVESCERSIP